MTEGKRQERKKSVCVCPVGGTRLGDQPIHRFAHHAKALSGSAFDGTKDLPETAHSPCQVAMATVRRNHKTNTDEKNNLCDIIIYQLLYDFVKLGKASGKNPDRVGSG